MLGLSKKQLGSIDQELKEAVCNAIVNLTVTRVTGSGEEGKIIYGSSPRRAVVSGQLLPRYDERNEDDTSDIRIAALGIDFQVGESASCEALFEPSFSTYVRILPEWDEINDENLGLEIEFEIVRAIQQEIDARIAQLRIERFTAEGVEQPQWKTLTPIQKDQVRATRNRIQQAVRIDAYRERGIHLEPSDDDLLAYRKAEEEAENSPEPAEARLRIGRLIQRGRMIPYDLLAPADTPAKWKRIDFVLPVFRWNISRDAEQLAGEIGNYSELLRQTVIDQVSRWLQSPEGIRNAWRNLRVSPSDIGSAEAWRAFRARAEAMPVPINDLLPKLDRVTIQIDRIRDYVDLDRASIRVTLDNETSEVTRREARTKTDVMFCAGFKIRFPSIHHRSLKLDRVEPSYRFRNFLNYHAIGLNCGVEHQPIGEDIQLSTTWAPRFIQPRILPRSIDKLPVSFAVLASEEFDVSELLRLPQEYTKWADDELKRLKNSCPYWTRQRTGGH